MEILKGFVFDIQRFGAKTLDLTLSTSLQTATVLDLSGATSGDLFITATKAGAASAELDLSTDLSGGALEITTETAIKTADAKDYAKIGTVTITGTGAKQVINVSLDDSVLNTSTYTNSITWGAGTTFGTDVTGTITLTSNNTSRALNVAGAIGGTPTGSTAQSITLDGTQNVVDASSLVLGATASAVPFATGTTTVSFKLSNNAAMTIKGTATVNNVNLIDTTTNAGVTAMAAGTEVTGVTTGDTAATAGAAGTYSVNGASMKTDNAAALTFTAAETGVSRVQGLATGKSIEGVTENAAVDLGAGGTFKINTQEITLTSTTGVATVKSNGIEAVTGATSITGWTATAGYTVNGETITVSNTSDAINITSTAANDGITAIAGLDAGSEFTITKSDGDKHTGVSVTTGALAAKDTTGESSVVTVNGTKFYAGRTTAGSSANTGLTLKTKAVGSLLTDGTVFLDGSTSTEVVVASSTALTTQEVTIKTTKGDISVYANNGAWTVHDLDNGDSFTAAVNGVETVYQVINGVLYYTTTGGTAQKATGSTLASGTEGKYSLQIGAAAGLSVATPTVAATIEDNVYSSAGDAIGATKSITLTVDTQTYSNFVVGSTNYTHANGIIDTDSTNATGSVTYDDNAEVFTYNNLTNKAQTISLAGDTSKWIVNGGEKDDTITGNDKGSTLNGGAGSDTIYAGANDVAFGGDGNDKIVATGKEASISGGAGADTLDAGAQTDVTLTGGDGADIFALNQGLFSDYNFGEDVVLTSKTQAQVRDLTKTVANFKSNGVFTDGTGTATLTSANEYAVKFKTTEASGNKEQVVAWAGENSANLDASSLTRAVILMGNTNEAADTLIGGSKDDTIYAGAGDSVYGGAGSNTISLTGAKTTETVYFNGTGKNVVTGFATGFDEETSDKLIIDGVSSLTSSLDGSNLTIKSGSSNMVLNNVSSSGIAKVRVGDQKAIFASDTATVKLETLTDADFYYGTKGSTSSSKLDLSAIEEAVNLDLTNDTVIRNFTSVKGGAGDTTLIGSKANETLVSGGGNTSLYGGAGKDVLVGATKVKDTFFMFAGGGNDTISGYEGYTESTADTADVVVMEELTGAKLISGGVQLSGKDADKLFISGANANTEIQYKVGDSVGIAKIGSVGGANSFTFANEVNYYGGGNAVDTLTFGSSDSDNHKVWLDGSKGTTYASIDVINASAATGDLELAGDSSKQTITGGKGSSSLWGGAGATNDVLKGGTGTNTFFYGLAEGNDTITCGTVDDVVNLYNIGLGDLASGEITSSAVTLTLKDSSKLTVNTGSRDIAFKLSDGSTYVANHSTKQWDNA